MSSGTPPAAADLRTQEVRRLIARAQDGEKVVLATVTALDLCVLGGPKHPFFDEPVARAWLSIGKRQRTKYIDAATRHLVQRGLLLADPAGGHDYAMQPRLGVALAGRCRPGFIITAGIAGPFRPQAVLFALGDATDPLQAIIVETTVSAPAARELGPLGWCYGYTLTSIGTAAHVLADWAVEPVPDKPQTPAGTPRIIARYPPDSSSTPSASLIIRNDGTTTTLSTGQEPPRTCEPAGLPDIMLRLIEEAPYGS